jgi:hypothetical protein
MPWRTSARTLGLLKPSIDVRRSLSEHQWAFAMEVLHEKPDTPERRRLQLLLELGSTTGLALVGAGHDPA